jgi:hypothetical protein
MHWKILNQIFFIDSLAFFLGQPLECLGARRLAILEEGLVCERDECHTLAGDSDASNELAFKIVDILMVDHFLCRHKKRNCALNYSS